MYVDCSTTGAAETLEDHFEPLQIIRKDDNALTKHRAWKDCGIRRKEEHFRRKRNQQTKGNGHAGKCPEKEASVHKKEGEIWCGPRG